MTALALTDLEKAAFCREVTRKLALDYFFVFDNVPLHFVFRDKVIPGDLTQLEKRNKAVTETLWTEAYHTYLMSNIAYRCLYRGSVLQMALQVHETGAGAFGPGPQESRPVYATVEEVRATFDTWMESTGWNLVADSKASEPRGSWQTVLSVPDRTMRIASLIPVGNQVLTELIVTWSEDGVLKETAFAAVLLYDVDGTVLQDRSYIELANWPSSRRWERGRSNPPRELPQTIGVMDGFYEYQRARQIDVDLDATERRNLSIVERGWVNACNTGLGTGIFHPERFRMQLPLQKCSYNLDISKEIEAIIKKDAPDREVRLALTYAKGNQVVAEGVISWTQEGDRRESPFISFLLLDKDGLIIRDRRYLSLDNWPGADDVIARLDL